MSGDVALRGLDQEALVLRGEVRDRSMPAKAVMLRSQSSLSKPSVLCMAWRLIWARRR